MKRARKIAWGSALTISLAVYASTAAQQGDIAIETELARYRAMMKADPWSNPGMLDVDRGEALWKTPRGPKKASLDRCDLGLGPGKIDGAFAQLPRYFADADQVMDVEARVLWCMQTLQGFDRGMLVARPHPGSGSPATELGAIATYVAHRSSGLKFAAPFSHPKEKEMLALGEAIFHRRSGPLDFACSTCHGGSGKRIRLQSLPFFSNPSDAQKVVGEWPAYRVSAAHVMTMQHRIYDCFWQMRLPEAELASDVSIAIVSYLVKQAAGRDIDVPGMKR